MTVAGRFRWLFAELKRRRVLHAVVWYVGGAFAVVEGLALFLDALGAPEAWTGFIATLALLCFPLAMTLAWLVEITAAGIGWADAPRTSEDGESDGRIFLLRRVGVLAIVASFVVVGTIRAWPRDDSISDEPREAVESALDPARVAILEFSLPTADDALTAFAEHLHERLIAALGLIEEIGVISLLGVRPFSGGDTPVDSIARALQAGTIVAPTIEAYGPPPDSIEVRLSFIDGETGALLRSSFVKAALPERHGLIEAVADTVSEALRRELGPAIEGRLRLRETESAEAFEAVISATGQTRDFDTFLNRDDLVAAEQALNEAERLLEVAERHDPDWVEPTIRLGRLAERRYKLETARRSPDARAQTLREGLRHAERALRKSADDPEALELRGYLLLQSLDRDPPAEKEERDRRLENAESDLRAALINHPVRARVLRTLSEVMAEQGRYQAAVTYAAQAYERDPYLANVGSIILRLFQYTFEMEQDSAAARWCGEGGRRYPGAEEGFLFRDCRLSLSAWTDLYQPDPDLAWRLHDEILAGYPAALRSLVEPRLKGNVSVVLARAGLADSAVSVVTEARERDETGLSTVAPEIVVLYLSGRLRDALDRAEGYRRANPQGWSRLVQSRPLRTLLENEDFSEALSDTGPAPR